MKVKDILDNHRILLGEVNRTQKLLEDMVFNPGGFKPDLDGFRGTLRQFAESVAALDRFEQREWGEQ